MGRTRQLRHARAVHTPRGPHATRPARRRITPRGLWPHAPPFPRPQVVFGAPGVGMVFAASAATTLINDFNATVIVFTGVAGGLLEGQAIGDVVIGEEVVNYDMDCRGFKYAWDPTYQLKLGETPFVSWAYVYKADPELLALAQGSPQPPPQRAKGTVQRGLAYSANQESTSSASCVNHALCRKRAGAQRAARAAASPTAPILRQIPTTNYKKKTWVSAPTTKLKCPHSNKTSLPAIVFSQARRCPTGRA